MRPPSTVPSRRCSECGKWFAPNPRAAKTQMTCSKPHSLVRRGRRAKERRRKDLEATRAAEVVRQRRCREAKRAAPGPAPPESAVMPEALLLKLEAVLAATLGEPASRAVLLSLANRVAEGPAG